MIAIGIDPGKSGGIAVQSIISPEERTVLAEAMPGTIQDLVDLMEDILGHSPRSHNAPTLAVVEKVHSMPGQGVKSTFSFGENFGQIQGVLTAMSIPWDLVTPKTWQKEFNLNGKFASKTQRKNEHKARAQSLFPHLKQITHATADALLLSEYARRRA